MVSERMTCWRAVGSPFLVALGIEIVGMSFYLVGKVFDLGVLVSFHYIVPWVYIAGIVGGFIAGYRSASGLTSGCWHGLQAGAIGGLGMSIVINVVHLMTGKNDPFGLGIGATVYLILLIAILGVIAGGSRGDRSPTMDEYFVNRAPPVPASDVLPYQCERCRAVCG